MTRSDDSFWRRNGLSLVLIALMALSLLGQIVTGSRVYNQELLEHGAPPLSLWAYLGSGHFISATFENWESEFLQRQKDSPQSKPLQAPHSQTGV